MSNVEDLITRRRERMKNTSGNKTAMSPPWVVYYRKICELFGSDQEVEVSFDDYNDELTLKVSNYDKANAIRKLLPTSINFGGAIMGINVVPVKSDERKIDLIQKAFNGNPILNYICTNEDIFGSNPIHYVVFKKDVVQYYNDDLGDVNGICSTLYQDIAGEILSESDGIHYCTDTK